MKATVDGSGWREDPDRIRDALEANRIVCFPACPVPLPDAATLIFLLPRATFDRFKQLANHTLHCHAFGFGAVV